MSTNLKRKFATQKRIFATAIMFMTRIPIGDAGSGDPHDLAASTQYFPLVGIIVGAGGGLVYWLAQLIWSNNIAIVLCVISTVLLTGGFHEDGLADVADSAGAWTTQRKLEIMRDSRIGTYGGLALVLSMLLSVIALIDVADNTNSADNSVGIVMATLILAHVLGRWSSLALIFTTKYARDDAANKVFVAGVNLHRLLIGSLITIVVIIGCYTWLSYGAAIALLVSLISLFLARLWFKKNIGGITGDCLGAANKLVEIIVCLSVAASLPT